MLIFRPSQATGAFSTWLIASVACAQPLSEKAARPPGASPEVIQTAIDARRAHRTARSKLSVTYYASSRKERRVYPGVPEPVLRNRIGLNRRETPVTEHLTIERVQDTVRQTASGDDTGFRLIDYEDDVQWRKFASDENILKADLRAGDDTRARSIKQHGQPRFALIYDGIVWTHEGDAVYASASTPEGAALSGFPKAVLDVPSLGAAPFVRSGAFPVGALGGTLPWQFAPSERTARSETRLEKHAYNPVWRRMYRMEWILDDSRGGQPVRATLYEDDRMIRSAVTSLQKVGERWFPQAVDFYRDDFADGLEPYMTIRVDEASFDEPWHRQEPFTPEDIGFVFGTQVVSLPRERLPVFGKLGVTGIMWDGVQLISGEDYWSMIHLYGMSEHPMIVKDFLEETGWSSKQYLEWQEKQALIFRLRWEKAYGPIDIPGREKKVHEDDWDVYVRNFVVKHKLSEERKDAAESLLEHSKGLRDWHRHKYRQALEKAKKAGDLRRAQKLEEPVGRIFKFLKRGLLRLLPRPDRNRE